MWTQPMRALLLQVALAALAALLAKRAKAVAIAFGAATALGAPWLAGTIPLLRGLSALIGFIGLLRVVELTRSREPWSAARRLLHVSSFVDSRVLRRAEPRIDLVAFGGALLWAALAGAGHYVTHWQGHLARWGGGLVFAYAAVESGYAFIGVAYRWIGFVTPPLHVLPLASISVAELWGVRWARPVSAGLRETCFVPLARRGHPVLGLVLGFGVSAFGHAYAVLVAIDLPMASMMFAYFATQGVFVLLESRLATSRWPRSARRMWTVIVMVASSPLFVEPVLRVLNPR